MTLERSRIRRMANLLEDEGLGGTLQMQFDPDRVERLMEAQDPAAQTAAHHHWNARFASSSAHEADKAGNAEASHSHHSHAAEMHRTAAKHLAAAGDVHTARVHDQWAKHHEAHAAAHGKSMKGADHSAHVAPPAAVKPEKAAKEKKPGILSKLKSKLAPKGSKVDWGKEAEKTAKVKPVGVHKDPFKGSAKKKEMGHSERATAAGGEAHELSTNKHVGSEHKAAAHKNASHEHLHAALASFHSGDHEKAMTHFNAAIHHMNKHHDHMSDVAGQGRQAARNKAPAGPRARVGRAHV